VTHVASKNESSPRTRECPLSPSDSRANVPREGRRRTQLSSKQTLKAVTAPYLRYLALLQQHVEFRR
jgi:hypothetical protein